jgi:hypothetical protein
LYKCDVTVSYPVVATHAVILRNRQTRVSPLTFAAEAVANVARKARAVKAAQSVGAVGEHVTRSVLALIFICKTKLQLQFSRNNCGVKFVMLDNFLEGYVDTPTIRPIHSVDDLPRAHALAIFTRSL